MKKTQDTTFEQCMKCTVCTVYCPVVAVNPDYPGPKQAGPDGERYRLKNPLFYDEALDLCLNCKRCEDVYCMHYDLDAQMCGCGFLSWVS